MSADGLRLGMFISGSGTTAEATWNATKIGYLNGVNPILLIASARNIGGIPRLLQAGFPKRQIVVLRPKDYQSEEQYGAAILAVLRQFVIDHIGLFGYLNKLPLGVVEEFRGRSQNQHPGILDPPHPDFGGKGMYGTRVHWATHYFSHHNPHRQFFWTAATAQCVELEYDKGAVIEEETMIFPADWTPEDIKTALLPFEWRVQIRALQRFANGCVAPVRRKRPIFSPNEIPILEKAKELAKLAIP